MSEPSLQPVAPSPSLPLETACPLPRAGGPEVVPGASKRTAVWLWFARGFALAALGFAGYLLWLSSGEHVAGCGNEDVAGCADVLASRWARWLGMPVSLPGAAAYALALVALFAVGPRRPAAVQRASWGVLLVIAVTMAGAACWFLGLQKFDLKTFCPYCLGAHACGLAAAVLILWHCPVSRRAAPLPAEAIRLRPGAVGMLAAVGLAAPACLVAGQLYGSAADARIEVEKPRPAEPSLAREAHPSRSADKTQAAPGSQQVVVELFDYTCDHCRRLHQDLQEAQKRYGERLSVAPKPMAMCALCNPYVQKTPPGHEQACEYARLALAVKSVDAKAFARFHAWLLDAPTVPPLDVARQHAAELIGTEALDRAVRSAGVEAELQQNIALYAATGQGKIPKLIFKDHSVLAGLPGRAQLFQVLEQHAGVKALER